MFNNSLTPMDGVRILLGFGVVMISLTLWVIRGRPKTKKEFLLAGREVGIVAGAMSIGASWIWAPAMFVSSQKAYEDGIAGFLWYIVPNIGTLILFGQFAAKLRTLLPEGYTLPQYIQKQHGFVAHILYLIQFFTLQTCSLAVQILAASQLLATTTGMNFAHAGILVAAVPVTYAVIGGLRASVATDYLQMIAMFIICTVAIPWAISNAGGVDTLISGLGGKSGTSFNPFDRHIVLGFGIPITIGLLSGPLGDQMQWQRAYALRKNGNVKLTFALGALVFGMVPLTLCNLGFLSANHGLSDSWALQNAQMVGPTAIANLLPHYMLVVFILMVLAGLCSTIDSSLCAIASLVTTLFFPVEPTDGHGRKQRWISRMSMIIFAALGYAIAQVPDLQIVDLFIYYGIFRAATAIPTVLTLKWSKLDSRTVSWAIIGSAIVGFPLAIHAGKNDLMKTIGAASVPIIGFLVCYFGSLFLSPKPEIDGPATEVS